MRIKIASPFAVNEKGQRENNEDNIFPAMGESSTDSTLFLVCDGVGGNEKGEIASELACKHFEAYFLDQKIETSNEKIILLAFNYVQDCFDDYTKKNPESKGMGTTLTLAHLHNEGITVAHCGDSRIYHFRQGKILFKTLDHNITNELFKQGIITEEEAKESKKTNRISRAMQGNSVQKTKPDVEILTDIQAGDYILTCTDGILEGLTDEELKTILSTEQPELEKQIQDIRTLCEENSRDNYSAYLIYIEEVEKTEEEEKENLSKQEEEINTSQTAILLDDKVIGESYVEILEENEEDEHENEEKELEKPVNLPKPNQPEPDVAKKSKPKKTKKGGFWSFLKN
jgi:protein phosphatase